MPIKTILTAIALEGADDPVFARAMQLAHQHGAKLIALHVLEDAGIQDHLLPTSADGIALPQILTTAARDQIAAMADVRDPQIDLQIRIESGKPAALIDQMALDENVDLVVIGPGKPKTIRERMFGSTADRVTRILGVPVLVVKSAPRPYQRTAIAMDFSDPAQAVARAALKLAPDARHELVHVTEIPLVFEQAMLKAGTPQPEIDRYRTAKSSQARQRMHEFAAQLSAARQPRIRVLSGDPGPVLMRLARSNHADLLAIGRHGGAPASTLLTGSVARTILHAATCDVLVCGADRVD